MLGRLLDAVNISFSVLSCLMHALDTYMVQRPPWFIVADALISLTFCGFFVLNFLTAKKKAAHMLRWTTWVELVSILPVFTVGLGTEVSLPIKVMRLLRVLRIVNVFIVMKYIQNEIEAQLFRCGGRRRKGAARRKSPRKPPSPLHSIGFTILSITFVTTAVIELCENLPELQPEELPLSHEHGLLFHNAYYFVITTITTVGYGDIAPITGLGKLTIMAMIGGAFLLIPKQTNELIALLSTQSVYVRQRFQSSSAGSHIIICGSIGSTRPGQLTLASREGGNLLPFFRELFNDDHGNIERSAVVLAQGLPSPQLQGLLSHPKYALGITYLDGSVMEVRHLKRACADSAKAVFIMANKRCSDANAEDASVILRALSLKRFAFERSGADLITCVQLLRPENKPLFFSTAEAFGRAAAASARRSRNGSKSLDGGSKEDTRDAATRNLVVCVEELKMNLMSKSCVCPGLVTMLYNLVASDDPDASGSSSTNPWQSEYDEGCSYEIYRVALSPQFQGISFREAAHAVYEEAGVVLFALELTPPGEPHARVALNPSDLLIPQAKAFNLHAFVIAEDKREADVVSTFGTRGGNGARALLAKLRSDSLLSMSGTGSKDWQSSRRSLHLSAESIASSDRTLGGLASFAPDLYTPPTTPVTGVRGSGSSPHQDPIILSTSDSSLQAHITDHIVVCGSGCTNPGRLFQFAAPLRAPHIPQHLPIVVLHHSPPSHETMTALAEVADLFFIIGSPLDGGDLQRAGLTLASSIVIFAEQQPALTEVAARGDALVDAESICIYRLARSLNPRVNVSCELVEESSMSFLANMNASGSAMRSAAFAAGHVYTDAILDITLCQAYFNPHIVNIFEALAAGTNPLKAQIWRSRMQDVVGDVVESHLHLIRAPQRFVGSSYASMFKTLLRQQGMLCLGLRRAGIVTVEDDAHGRPGASQASPVPGGNLLPYVLTNPNPKAVVGAHDGVYVLSQFAPQDTVVKGFGPSGIVDEHSAHERVPTSSISTTKRVVGLAADEMRRKSSLQAVMAASMGLKPGVLGTVAQQRQAAQPDPAALQRELQGIHEALERLTAAMEAGAKA